MHKRPDVLIVVLSGVGPQDNVAMDYSTLASPKRVQRDLIDLQNLTGWRLSEAQASIEQPSIPGAKASTAATFIAPSIVNAQQGTLPIEPFITVLKRFRTIEIDYSVSPQFTYRGLKDFENDYVKIKMRQSGTTYRFDITVKNHDFKKLDLPVTQVEQTKRSRAESFKTRILIIIGIAVLASVAVFLIMYFVGRKRQQG